VLATARYFTSGLSTKLVVEASVTAGWDAGTFPDTTECILYHYKKHVMNEGGRVSTIAGYTNHALWVRNNYHYWVGSDPNT
jgi:hypothetical protein